MADEGKFPWSWILGDRIQVRKEKKISSWFVFVLQTNFTLWSWGTAKNVSISVSGVQGFFFCVFVIFDVLVTVAVVVTKVSRIYRCVWTTGNPNTCKRLRMRDKFRNIYDSRNLWCNWGRNTPQVSVQFRRTNSASNFVAISVSRNSEFKTRIKILRHFKVLNPTNVFHSTWTLASRIKSLEHISVAVFKVKLSI